MLTLSTLPDDFEKQAEVKKFAYTNKEIFEKSLTNISEKIFNVSYQEIVELYHFNVLISRYAFDKTKDPEGSKVLEEVGLDGFGTLLLFDTKALSRLLKDIEKKVSDKIELSNIKKDNFFLYIEMEYS